jgi:hypothetical protein
MEQSPSSEANRFSASQEFPHILQKPNTQYRTHKCPPPVPFQSQNISPGPRLSVSTFRNVIHYYGEESLAPRPTPKLEDHRMSAVCDCLFNIFAATLHVGGRSSVRNVRMLPWWQGPTYHGFQNYAY